MEWSVAYKVGNFTLWENETPSPELVAMVAIQGQPSSPKTALDIGCGAGREALFLSQHGYNVIGVDLTEEALEIARERSNTTGLRVDWRLGNALELPVDSHSIDFINDRGCFHIITSENDRTAYAEEVVRVLRPGGSFLLRGCSRKLDPSFFEDQADLAAPINASENPFEPITEKVVDQFFPETQFIRSPVLAITLGGKHKHIPGNLVYLTKK